MYLGGLLYQINQYLQGFSLICIGTGVVLTDLEAFHNMYAML